MLCLVKCLAEFDGKIENPFVPPPHAAVRAQVEGQKINTDSRQQPIL